MSCDPDTALLGICREAMKSAHGETAAFPFIAALLTKAKIKFSFNIFFLILATKLVFKLEQFLELIS